MADHRARRVAPLAALTALVVGIAAPCATAQIMPATSCDAAGIGAAAVAVDGPAASIVEVSAARATAGSASVTYCLVKVRVPEAINIWIALPMDGAWNGRLQSQGGGGYAGTVAAATNAVLAGYVGITTDTGHTGS